MEAALSSSRKLLDENVQSFKAKEAETSQKLSVALSESKAAQKAHTEATVECDDLKGKISALNQDLTAYSKRYDETRAELLAVQNNARTEITKYEAIVSQQASQIETLNKSLALKEEHVANTIQQSQSSAQHVALMQAEINKAQVLAREASAETQVARCERDNFKSDLDALKQKMESDTAKFEARVKSLQEELQEANDKASDLESSEQMTKDKLDSAYRELEDLEATLQEYKDELQELRDGGNEEDEPGLLAGKGFSINPQLIAAEDKIDELKDQLKILDKEKSKLEDALNNKLQSAKRQLANVEDTLQSTKVKLSTTLASLELKEEQCSKLQQEVDDQIKKRMNLNREKEDVIKSLRSDVDSLRNDMNVLHEELEHRETDYKKLEAKLKIANEQFSNSKHLCDQLQDEVIEWKLKSEELQSDLSLLQEEDKHERTTQSALQAHAAKIAEKQSKISDLEKQMKTYTAQIADANLKIAAQSHHISSLEAKVALLQGRERELQQALAVAKQTPEKIVYIQPPPEPAPPPPPPRIATPPPPPKPVVPVPAFRIEMPVEV